MGTAARPTTGKVRGVAPHLLRVDLRGGGAPPRRRRLHKCIVTACRALAPQVVRFEATKRLRKVRGERRKEKRRRRRKEKMRKKRKEKRRKEERRKRKKGVKEKGEKERERYMREGNTKSETPKGQSMSLPPPSPPPPPTSHHTTTTPSFHSLPQTSSRTTQGLFVTPQTYHHQPHSQTKD